MRAFSRGALGIGVLVATALLPAARGQAAIECTADGNQDGVINVADLLALLADYGSSEAPYDTNGDGRVDVTVRAAPVSCTAHPPTAGRTTT